MPMPSRKGILPSGRMTRRKFCRERLRDSNEFAKGSFRTKHPPGRPDVNLVVGCRKGYWKHGRCTRSTEVQAILHPFSSGHCPRGIYEIVDRQRTGGLIVPLTDYTWHALKGLKPIRAYRGKHARGAAALRRKENLRLRRKEAQRRVGKLTRAQRGDYTRLTVDRDFRGGFSGLAFGVLEMLRKVILPPEPPPWLVEGSGVFGPSESQHKVSRVPAAPPYRPAIIP